MFTSTLVYAVLAVLVCCKTTSGERIPKQMAMVGTPTSGDMDKISVQGRIVPASRGQRDIDIKVRATRQLDITHIISIDCYLETLCRDQVKYITRSTDKRKAKNFDLGGPAYKFNQKSLVLRGNAPSKLYFNIRFINADKFLGYGHTFQLTGYNRRKQYIKRKVTITWFQKEATVYGGLYKQSNFKSKGCMVASIQLIVPAVNKYKFIIKAFVGKSYNNQVTPLYQVEFKVKDKARNGRVKWTWLGLRSLRSNKKIKPDRRFPGAQFKASLSGYAKNSYAVVGEIIFSDFKQAIGHTFAITFVARKKNKSIFIRHVEASVDWTKQKPTPRTRPPPPPTTRRPPPPPTTRRPPPPPTTRRTPPPVYPLPRRTPPPVIRPPRPGGRRINPADEEDEDEEEEEEDEDEDKVSIVVKNIKTEESGNGSMVAIAGVVVGLLVIILIGGGLYVMKSKSSEKSESPEENSKSGEKPKTKDENPKSSRKK